MTITTFDKPTLRLLHAEIKEALAPLAERYGLDLDVRPGSFDPNEGLYNPRATFKLKTRADGRMQETVNFERWAPAFGLQPSDYCKTVNVGGVDYRLTGFAPSRSKFPVVVERVSDGKVLGLVARDVVRALGRATVGV